MDYSKRTHGTLTVRSSFSPHRRSTRRRRCTCQSWPTARVTTSWPTPPTWRGCCSASLPLCWPVTTYRTGTTSTSSGPSTPPSTATTTSSAGSCTTEPSSGVCDGRPWTVEVAPSTNRHAPLTRLTATLVMGWLVTEPVCVVCSWKRRLRNVDASQSARLHLG